MSEHTVRIGDREVGPGRPVYLIAEAGVNHNGDPALAKRLVEAAAEAGADAVKFQTWITDKLVTPEAPLAGYQARNTGGGASQREMLQALELRPEALRELKALAETRAMMMFSTPDEEDSADLLEELGVCAFKIGSAEVTNTAFLQHVARKGRPLILSTGMSDLAEVTAAVRAIEATGNRQLVLLHCVSDYPCAPAECNLRAMDTLREAFGHPVGFSDHSLGHAVAVAAAARGACVIEKHLTLDTSMSGPDHAASLDPPAFAAMVRAVREAESALGTGLKEPTASERAHRPLMRKRWVASRPLAAGTRLSREDLALRRSRPEGLDPSELSLLLGHELRQGVGAWEVLTLDKLK
jgi:sialic acid synthase SpsE